MGKETHFATCGRPECLRCATAAKEEIDRLRTRLSETEDQVLRMARLLLECRDALPAISTKRAALYHVDLTLADRIEGELKPWEVPDDE